MSFCILPVPALDKHGRHIWTYIMSIDQLVNTYLFITFDEPFFSTWKFDFMEFNQSLVNFNILGVTTQCILLNYHVHKISIIALKIKVPLCPTIV